MGWLRSLSLLAFLVVAGACSPGGSVVAEADPDTAQGAVRTYLVAVDTSDSAKVTQTEFGRQIRDELTAFPLSCELRLFRFDSAPAEVSSGPPPERDNEAALLLKEVFKHRSKTPGTNMAKLVRLLDSHLDGVRSPVEIRIYTDAGTELMTEAERDDVRKKTAQWGQDDRVARVEVTGLRDGQRETIRDIFRLPPEKLKLGGRVSGS
jgi:hypothetical protein